MESARRRIDVAAVLLLASLVSGPAAAVPRYALRAGQNCALCHENPDGGGARSPYAAQYLVPARLAMLHGDAGAKPTTNPQISQDLVLGADLRTFWLGQQKTTSRNNFVQMQGSLYLTLQLDPRLTAYVHEELGQGASAYEIFGTAWIVPGELFAKVGRFVPPFGWRPSDHRTFTRREFVFLPTNPPQSDTGIELGFRKEPFELDVGLTNGEFASAFELNDELALVARGQAMRSFGGLNLAVGGSYWQHRGLDRQRWAGGPFAGASWGRLTWWGEFDWLHSIFPSGGAPLGVATSFTTSQELAIQVVQGVDVVGTYDFTDPDTRLQSGAGSRIGGGLETWPLPALRVRAKVNYFQVDEGPAFVDANAPPTQLPPQFDGDSLPDGVVEGEVEIHFLY
ncbi:MAG: hypothetical protein U0167_05475 [bacterium]